MSLSPGTSLGPYQIVAPLGAGGMGEVYKATDTNLKRQVAIKVLPDALATDAERLARFQREAEILAALNHPHIAAIYGLERSGGQTALVLELVEGPTLADRIAQGAIPVDEALPIAHQIAEALEAAHEAGVIHRDLKPANIKLRPDGTVKVLDFGLAKALDPAPASSPGVSQSPTLSMAATQQGIILGTAGYMSPEQAKGWAVDKRTDIWAFGCVLFEMLSGRQSFGASDVSEALAAVIRADPDWSLLPADLHPGLRRVLQRCLTKDPARRIRDIGDVRFELEQARAEPEGPPDQPAVEASRASRRPWIGGIVATALVASIATWLLTSFLTGPGAVPAEPVRFVVVTPSEAPLSFGRGADLAIAPDGTFVVYVGRTSDRSGRMLYVRHLGQVGVEPLRGTEGGAEPFVSPDGQWVGLVDASTPTIRRVSILGGASVRVVESPDAIAGVSWRPDGQLVFGTNEAGLFRVSAGGGDPEPVTTPDGDEWHRWPAWIPAREAVVFTIGSGRVSELAVADLDTGVVTRLGVSGTSPRYVPTGHLVYAVADGSVRAVPFDVSSLEVTGTPVPLIEGVGVKAGGADAPPTRNLPRAVSDRRPAGRRRHGGGVPRTRHQAQP